jgi:glutamine cyclotransferase
LVQTTTAHASAATESGDRLIQGQCNATGIRRLQGDVEEKMGRLIWPHRLADVSHTQQSPPVQYTYRLVKRYPHDPKSFTQGLVFLGDRLFESTGMWGASTVREVDLNTGEVLRQIELEDHLFGEGLAVWNKRFVQLTWRSNIAFVYDTENLHRIAKFSYTGEGWGSTSVEDKLVISQGSALLTWIDPKKDGTVDALQVREGGQLVYGLNELEYVEGKILANVWPSDCIAEIDHETGQVTGWIDLSGLYPQKSRPQPKAVLNGIAYNSAQKRLFVTGKYWPYLYEIERAAVQSEQQAAPPTGQ